MPNKSYMGVTNNLKMRILNIFILILSCNCLFSQKSNLGVDLGYQVGKFQYFETGLNLTVINDSSTFGGALSVGLLDNLNSTNFGYKVGLTGYNLKSGSLPIAIGLNVTQHNQNDTKFLAFSPEIGLAYKYYYFGSGLAYISFSYGHNFTDNEFKNKINKHYFKFMINTNMRGFIEFLGFMGYKIVSVFHPNWS